MSKKEIDNIQDFLTIVKEEENRRHQIVNVELMLRRHPPSAVIDFLNGLHKEYARKLQKVIREDKTSQRLNKIISTKFRIKMAINCIKNAHKQGGQAA
ncbi:MAG: hypothetical protein HOA72_22895 [Desulfobacula sp.]|jgi:hypothetical protein|uniref:hypothetical protein n=1 Tax=Desulfobacula sp. TaxID=2593537 RepID=UPI002A082159|nr:hypothetical protein [Desulfobacula sp.]